jgi:hypothetical protein
MEEKKVYRLKDICEFYRCWLLASTEQILQEGDKETAKLQSMVYEYLAERLAMLAEVSEEEAYKEIIPIVNKFTSRKENHQ